VLTPLFQRIRPHFPAAAVLLLITAVIYCRILGHDFQLFWDDEKYVTANEAVKGFSLGHLKSAFTRYYVGNYAPLHIISYMFDYSIFGMKASGFFLTNIALHSINGILFYMILIHLNLSRMWAFVAVFIFLSHPVQVESVAWISERKNLLALLFSLISFLLYVSYRKEGWSSQKWRYLASLVFFVLALLSKAVAVVLPVTLLIYDLCYLEKERRKAWLADKVPFFAAAAIMAWVTMQSQLEGNFPGIGGGRTPFHGGSPFATMLTMLTVLTNYMKLIFFPTGLSAIYDPPIRHGLDVAVLVGGLLFLLLAISGTVLFLRNRPAFFWFSLFFVGLLPVSQIVPIVTLMNDRYLYFPMIGVAGCIALLCSNLSSGSGYRNVVVVILLCLTLSPLPLLSFGRTAVWANDLTLWRDAVQKAPNHTIAIYGMAQALQNSGDLDTPISMYQRILQRDPRHLDALEHLAALYRSRNMPLEGRKYLLDITRFYPKYANGLSALGMNYSITGNLAEAEAAYQTALALQPESGEILSNLGVVALRGKKLDTARVYLRAALGVDGTNAAAAYDLACVEALSGNHLEALRMLEVALKAGFRNSDIIEKDPDLSALRPKPEYRELLRRYLIRQ
jgi:Tfp pilus assembly protein PilF